jgi:AcrR family transcriptional regulator/DNA-binding MarR family transcriptional regulator
MAASARGGAGIAGAGATGSGSGSGGVGRVRAAERVLPGERRVRRGPKRLAVSRSTPRVKVEEIQRSRLLGAAAATIDERGYEQASVASITARAGVSRRTFYELFGNREECLMALLEEVVERLEGELRAAGLEGLLWRERVRGGLWAILSFLDAEPVLARVCVVHALYGSKRAMVCRERILARLAGVLDEGRGEGPRGGECTLVTAEGLVGGAFGVVYARLRSGETRPLTELLNELMGMIALQYLGPRAARREQRRPAPEPVRRLPRARWGVGALAEPDPLQEVPMRLTYRTSRVLQCIAEHPGASNRAVGERAGIADPGQISKLLRRLEGLGLTVNTGGERLSGEPKAWRLTSLGGEVAQRLSALALDRTEAA